MESQLNPYYNFSLPTIDNPEMPLTRELESLEEVLASSDVEY
jgi:hypothetical protein